ncbi:MAG: hypothetical protein JWO20_2222 [Candidatus Angelobacter sp.]|jgi:hypothetical protein|nr:hypothetical protein [Candidatus Angelobacter sp.]
MRVLFVAGLIVLVLGVVSLFATFPQRERHGVNAGGISLGVETQHSEKLPPLVSAVLILGGAGMMIGSRGRA